MILRVRVGGGGRSSKSCNGRLVPEAEEDTDWRAFTGMNAGDTGDAGCTPDLDDRLVGAAPAAAAVAESMAAGGRANTSVPSIATGCWCSLTINSPDMAGVGGRRERDMVLRLNPRFVIWIYEDLSR